MTRRPEEHQVAAVRAELHLLVDRCVDDWGQVEHLASMALGRRGDGVSVQTSDVSNPTLAAVLAGESDPARRWLEEFRRLRLAARTLDSRRAELVGVAQRPQVAAADPCADCGARGVRMKRIDGQPFCATSCYSRHWRAGRSESA